ncbi:hypothetical protein BCR32DRAFT_277909 [Anaeromyces robustus]|uniref:Uncharacterized protein n=1 Tax=Anaeromyces robustus TaxID=1754192 RepID=A0A1Y1XCW8_9FUNG|nr:hypothetical protein BCR32DRAFT_277909 [Anaeromyces robustus]|eukprot:ORX83588.1 hypothetical protein BCR32DRAFT_277909 [Anaeromyces robustus]
MILNKEDIDIYLTDENTKCFYDEYNKENPDILKLLQISRDNKIYLYEPLNLDHFLLIDISLNCNQRFKISNINQFNRYIDMFKYYNLLYEKYVNKDKRILDNINKYNIKNKEYNLNDDFSIKLYDINENINKLTKLIIVNKFILDQLNNNIECLYEIEKTYNIIKDKYEDINSPLSSLFVLYIYNFIDYETYSFLEYKEKDSFFSYILTLDLIYDTNYNFNFNNDNRFNYITDTYNKDNKIFIKKLLLHYGIRNSKLSIYNLHDLYFLNNKEFNIINDNCNIENIPRLIVNKYKN